MQNLEILDQLSHGQMNFDTALRKIEKNRMLQTRGAQKPSDRNSGHQAFTRWFSGLTIRIREPGHHTFAFWIPLSAGSFAICLTGLSRKVRKKLQQYGLSAFKLQKLFRLLKSSDCIFMVDVYSHDGAEINIRNASRRKLGSEAITE